MVRKAAISLGLVALASCTSVSYGPVKTVQASAIAAPDLKDAPYRLGPGDKLQLTVYGEQNLSSEQQVAADGTIAVPLIGRVAAGGRSVSDVTEEVRSKLAEGFVHNPSVTITVENYRPFYILGEVNTPGQYEYAKGMTVLAAVARAGGFTYRAKRNEIFLKREGSPEELRVGLDIDMPIRPGDTIRIGERYF